MAKKRARGSRRSRRSFGFPSIQIQELFFPFKGLNTVSNLEHQGPETTPIAKNVRPFSVNGQIGGGQRHGWSKYVTAQAPDPSPGSYLPQAVGQVFYSSNPLSTASGKLASQGTEGTPSTVNAIELIDPSFGVSNAPVVNVVSYSTLLKDGAGGWGRDGHYYHVTTNVSNGNIFIQKLNIDGTKIINNKKFAGILDLSTNMNDAVSDVIVHGGILYVFVPGSNSVVNLDAFGNRVYHAGILRFSTATLDSLDNGAFWKEFFTIPMPGAPSHHPGNRMAISGNFLAVLTAEFQNETTNTVSLPSVTVFDLSAEETVFTDLINEGNEQFSLVYSHSIAGIGNDRFLISLSTLQVSPADDVRRIFELSPQNSVLREITGLGISKLAANVGSDGPHHRSVISYDSEAKRIILSPASSDFSAGNVYDAFTVVDDDDLDSSYDVDLPAKSLLPDDPDSVGTPLRVMGAFAAGKSTAKPMIFLLLEDSDSNSGVVVDVYVDLIQADDYDAGDFSGGYDSPHQVLAPDGSNPFYDRIATIQSLQSGTLLATAVRSSLSFCVSNGNFRKINTSGNTLDQPIGTGDPPGVLSSSATQIFWAQYGNKIFFADGEGYTYYDLEKDSLVTWLPSSGSLPFGNMGETASLITVWNSRIVLSGLQGERQNYFMTRQGDPFDMNFTGTVSDEQRAIAGNNGPAGLISDIINTLIPYRDDVLIFGCDKSIFQMTGNPAAGGRVDLITDVVGMPFGKPWCKTPEGIVYFVGSRGGVFQLFPLNPIRRITALSIHNELQEIDFDSNIVRMVWDDNLLGFFVFITPKSTGTTSHFFYDKRSGGWFKDVFAEDAMNPGAVEIFDGDNSNDRSIVMFSQDGYLRFRDQSAKDDAGVSTPVAIDSDVYIPIETGGASFVVRELQATLDSLLDGVSWSLVSGNTYSEALDSPTQTVGGTFSSGRNSSVRRGVRGQGIYLRLRNSSLGESWGIERVVARLQLLSAFAQRMNNQ